MFLENYNDKFVKHVYKLLKGMVVEKIRVKNALDINLLEFKSRFKPFCGNILLFKANSHHNAKNKCGGSNAGHAS